MQLEYDRPYRLTQTCHVSPLNEQGSIASAFHDTTLDAGTRFVVKGYHHEGEYSKRLAEKKLNPYFYDIVVAESGKGYVVQAHVLEQRYEPIPD